MATQTVFVDGTSVLTYLEEVADMFTTLMARDPDIVLTNDTMEGANTVAISSWALVKDTFKEALYSWVVDIQNRTALRVPIPENFYSLVYLLVERGCRDSRGSVRFPIQFHPTDGEPVLDSANQSALFGKRGYFATKWQMYTGTDFLRDGHPIVPHLMLTKEGNLSSKDTPVLTKSSPLDIGKVPVLVNFTSSAADYSLYVSQDGFDPDAFEMYLLLPPATISTAEFLDGRLYKLEYDPDMHRERVPRAALAAVWVYQKVPPFVRAFMPLEADVEVMTDVLTSTLLVAEQDSASSDMPAELPQMPPHDDTKLALATMLQFMNPMLVRVGRSEADTENDCRRVNALATVARDTLVPSSISESFRAHKFRFITYGKQFTGTIYTYIEQLQTPVAEIGKVLNALGVWKNIFSSVTTIETAPLVSLDFNRVPLTVKYCLRVKARDDKDPTSEISAAITTGKVQATALIRLAQRMGVYYNGTDAKVIVKYLQGFYASTDSDIGQLQSSFAAAWASIFGSGQDKLVDQIDILGNEKIDALQAYLDGKDGKGFPLSRHYANYWYDFTKFQEKDLIAVAGIICNAIVFPSFGSVDKRQHLLVKLGFRKMGPLRQKPQFTICGASLVERTTRRPRTEQGYALKHLARLGGFGFGALLGPLIGQLGGAIGQAVGVPEIGQIANTVGTVGGGILDAFL